MRRFLCAVFLLAWAAQAVAVVVPVRLCPDGVHRAPVVGYPAQCPRVVESAQVTALAETTASVEVTVDSTGGTLYGLVTSSSTPPHWKTIQDTATDSASLSSATTVTLDATGLPTGSTRYWHVMARTAANGYISAVSTVPFTTTSPPPPEEPGGLDFDIDGPQTDTSTKYFVSNSGNDANPGTLASPFRTLAPIEAMGTGALSGADVWIESDTDIASNSNGYDILLSGTFANRVKIACYYLDPGNSNQPRDCRAGSLGGRMDRDTGLMGSVVPWRLYGSVTKAALVALNQDWSFPRSDCSSEHGALLTIRGSYTGVHGGIIEDSACGGVQFIKDGLAWAAYDGQILYPELLDVIVRRTGGGAVKLMRGVKHPVLQKVHIERSGYCSLSRNFGGSAVPVYKAAFNSGGTTQPTPGQLMTMSGGGTARLDGITLTSGSWAAGTAAGTIWYGPITGTFNTSTGDVSISGGASNVFTFTQVRQDSGLYTFCGLGNAGWPGGISMHTSLNMYALLDQVTAQHTYGEGVNHYLSSKGVYRRLDIGNTHSTGFYADNSSHSVVERSRFWKTRRNPGLNSQNTSNFGGAMTLNCEDTATGTPNRPSVQTGHVWRGNILYGGMHDVGQWVQCRALGIPQEVYSLNNTFVSVELQAIENVQGTTSATFEHYFSNNIIEGQSGAGYDLTYPNWFSYIYSGGNCRTGTTGNHNAWKQVFGGASFTRCTGANDVGRSGGTTLGVPIKLARQLANTNAADYYHMRDFLAPPNPRDVYLTAESPAIGAANTAWKTTKLISDADAAEYYKLLEVYTEINTPTKLANWQNGVYYDYNGDEIGTDLGAIKYTATMPAIEISADGKNFEVDGVPWAWRGDTAWTIWKLSQAQVEQYLDDRAAKGFNVIQIMALAVNGLPFPANLATWDQMAPNYTGAQPFTSFSPVTLNNTYWAHVDMIVSEARKRRMYVAITGVWGSDADTLFPVGATGETNAYNYGKALAERYADDDNVIYFVMGEYQKIAWQTAPNDDNTISPGEQAIIDQLAEGIDDYKAAGQLISVHSNGSETTAALNGKSWLDFHQLQSFGSHTFSRTGMESLAALSPRRPALNTEGGYEDGTNASQGYPQDMTPHAIREELYLQAFAGGAGATYGHWLVWQFATGWESALSDTGALHGVRIGDVLERIGLGDMDPAQSLVVSGVGSVWAGTYNTAMRNAAGTKVAVYSSNGSGFSLNLAGKRWEGRWINPRNGDETLVNGFNGTSSYAFDPPGTVGTDGDMILLLWEL